MEPHHPGTMHMCPPLSPHLHHHGESIFPLKVSGHLKPAVLSHPLLRVSASANGPPRLPRPRAQCHGFKAQPHSELLPWEQACYISSLVRGELCLQIHMSKS